MISEPIKEHLRRRQDTLRCIVQSILADDSDLYEQLGQAYVRIPLRGKNHSSRKGAQEDTNYEEGENGGDPCIYALRLYVSEDEKKLVEENSGIVNG